jgi:hypothetical protein
MLVAGVVVAFVAMFFNGGRGCFRREILFSGFSGGQSVAFRICGRFGLKWERVRARSAAKMLLDQGYDKSREVGNRE